MTTVINNLSITPGPLPESVRDALAWQLEQAEHSARYGREQQAQFQARADDNRVLAERAEVQADELRTFLGPLAIAQARLAKVTADTMATEADRIEAADAVIRAKAEEQVAENVAETWAAATKAPVPAFGPRR